MSKQYERYTEGQTNAFKRDTLWKLGWSKFPHDTIETIQEFKDILFLFLESGSN